MDQSKLESYLGRPLKPVEVTNLKLYLKIARESLDDLLCLSLCDTDDPKVYESRDGYSTVFTDIFTEIDEIKVDGTGIDATIYSPRQWDKRNGSWFNSIVFDEKMTGKDVTVSALWGFSTMPTDLQALLAGLFDLITRKNKVDGTLKSKKVEDFQVTFDTEADVTQEFEDKHRRTIQKYSLCNVGSIRHGGNC